MAKKPVITIAFARSQKSAKTLIENATIVMISTGMGSYDVLISLAKLSDEKFRELFPDARYISKKSVVSTYKIDIFKPVFLATLTIKRIPHRVLKQESKKKVLPPQQPTRHIAYAVVDSTNDLGKILFDRQVALRAISGETWIYANLKLFPGAFKELKSRIPGLKREPHASTATILAMSCTKSLSAVINELEISFFLEKK